MAVLIDATRQAIHDEIQRTVDCPGTITKPQLRAVVDAIDSWVDSNAASFNTSIPLPQRTSLNVKQKSALLMWVVNKRYEVS